MGCPPMSLPACKTKFIACYLRCLMGGMLIKLFLHKSWFMNSLYSKMAYSGLVGSWRSTNLLLAFRLVTSYSFQVVDKNSWSLDLRGLYPQVFACVQDYLKINNISLNYKILFKLQKSIKNKISGQSRSQAHSRMRILFINYLNKTSWSLDA